MNKSQDMPRHGQVLPLWRCNIWSNRRFCEVSPTLKHTICTTLCWWASNATWFVNALSYRITCSSGVIVHHCPCLVNLRRLNSRRSVPGQERSAILHFLPDHRHNRMRCDLRFRCSTLCSLEAALLSDHLFQRRKTSSIQGSCSHTKC